MKHLKLCVKLFFFVWIFMFFSIFGIYSLWFDQTIFDKIDKKFQNNPQKLWFIYKEALIKLEKIKKKYKDDKKSLELIETIAQLIKNRLVRIDLLDNKKIISNSNIFIHDFITWTVSTWINDLFNENFFLSWNKDALISIVELWNIECEFCKQIDVLESIWKFNSWNIQKINYFYIDYPYINWNIDEFSKFHFCIWSVFWKDEFYNIKNLNLNNLEDFKNTKFIDEKLKLTCMQNDFYSTLYEQNIKYFIEIFKISWIPSVIIVDNVEKKYIILEWKNKIENINNFIEYLLHN